VFDEAVRVPLLALVALVLVAAGCGGGEAQPEPTLETAASRTEATPSARFEVKAPREAGGTPVGADCTGAVDYVRQRVQAVCQQGVLRLESIDIGRATFTRGGTDALWEMSPRTENRVIDRRPEKLLEVLRAASRRTERLPERDVRGTKTVGYRLTLTCAKADLVCVSETAQVEVWIDSGGLLRRLSSKGTGADGTIEIFDLGADVDIERPSADRVKEPRGAGLDSAPAGQLGPCSRVGAPIGVSTALETLRRRGFSSVSVSGSRCPAGVAAKLGNTDRGPDAFAQDGLVYCRLLAESPAEAWAEVVRTEGAVGGRAVDLTLENLTCRIVSARTDDAKVSRLEQTFDDLERALRR
jgi:hypothetical protein